MAVQCHMCLLGLIILCPLLTGISEAEVTHVFSSSGENVRLPCNNALPDCTSTTWNYNRHSEAAELIAGGIKKNDIKRRERLSVGSDCSLNIEKVTQEDYGLYTCQQYVNGQKQRTDAPVYLHFLHVSSSSSQTEIRPGSSVTLSCQLYSYDRYPCDTLVRTDGIQLMWVNQAGVSVMTDSRYQISFSSTHCISTLTTTLLNEDLNREWRCQVTQRNQPKASATYTVKYSAPNETKTPTPVTSLKTTTTVNKPVTSTQSETFLPSVIAGVVVALALLLLPVIFWVIRKKNPKADNKRGTDDSVEQKDDVTYTEVFTYSKKQDKNNKVHGDDTVTYASISGATAGPQDDSSQLYTSVNKNRHK
ncbi:uncharacterized protein LOC127497990 [Ctenopharyngodon idella]|uniref:uncharacterized protein LOC127497990 n=1 Tax=Ctenopharyngodon idella TaxID=7959 RepID=UPI00222E241B|nr:uncharacterized protein LOC127497990 [Ctenopharyngodon idella]